MASGLDNKISNIIGTKLPQWFINQVTLRANSNSYNDRSINNNLLYIANKTAWIRLVSSVDINQQRDQEHFARISNEIINTPQSLAKKFVLFGGTSKYKDVKSYELRSGISFSDPSKTSGGAYGILGKEEIQKYGYRPMPGIMSVNIDTQGRLGSVRAATINFKCWDKQQLDIIDALYFKLGFTMFLEWGHTFFYTSKYPEILKATEDYAIVDPFRSIKYSTGASSPDFLNKEEIYSQISETVRQTEGNYDAMLGMVTNFDFSYNQEGGYDCTLRLMSLGMLGDSIKINNPATLPKLLSEEIILLDKTIKFLNEQENQSDLPGTQDGEYEDAAPNDLLQFLALNKIVNYNINNTDYRNTGYKRYDQIPTASFQTIAFSNNNILSNTALGDFNNIVREMNTLESAFIFAPSNFTRQVKNERNEINFKLPSNEYYDVDYFVNDKYVIGKKNIILAPNKVYKNISLDLSYLKRRYSTYIESSRTQLRDPTLDVDLTELKNISSANVGVLGAGLLGFRQDSVNTEPEPSQYGVYANSYVQKTSPGIRFSVGYKSPTYGGTGPQTSDLRAYPATYFFSIYIDRTKKSSSGAPLKTIATNLEVYNILLDILESNILPVDSFEVAARPFTQSNLLKRVGNLSTIINNDLPYGFSVKFKKALNSKVRLKIVEAEVNAFTNRRESKQEDVEAFLDVTISFNDSSVFSSIESDDESLKIRSKGQVDAELESQNRQEAAKKEQERLDQEALLDQVQQSLSYQSSLELTLKTIQVHTLNKAMYQIPDKPDKNIGNKVFVLEIKKDKDFLKTILSNGLFSPFIDSVIYDQLTISTDDELKEASGDGRLKIYAKYGFLSSLLGNKSSLEEINTLQGIVDYDKLLTSFVIPYRIDQELVAGIKTNHPVYIPFGFLLMLMNHSCTIYDSKGDGLQTPLVYIDYNPELNFFLTTNQQLSIDPFKVLIPFEGNNKDYEQLFYDEVLVENKTGIAAYKDQSKSVPLFKPENDDLISYKIQEYAPIKFGKQIDNTSSFRGKVMNILLSIDYLTDLVKQYSLKDGTNSVYLRPFIEDVLVTINKSLGNFNSFRLAYNDNSNTFQIVDDQVVPTPGQEEMIDPKASGLEPQNRTEIPLIGKTSIAKTLQTKTDISSKLGSLIAISANPKMTDKSTLSTNADALGFLNTGFSDRVVTNRLAITSNTTSSLRDSRIAEAIMFNSTITDFYSSANPSDADVSQVTSYYIERMSKVKNSQSGSIASAMVPIGIDFSTDGISGMSMGQAFTVSDELLPYSYTAQFRPGYIDNYNRYVGFAIIGLNHTIESNQWNTAVRTNMIALKDKTMFKAEQIKALPPKNDRTFTEASEVANPNSRVNVNFLSSQLNVAIPFFKNTLKFNDIATAAAIGNLIQESGLNYQAWNIGATVDQTTTINAGSSRRDVLTDPKNLTFSGKSKSGQTFTNKEITAYGIAQWTQTRKKAYIQFRDKNGGDSLETQLKFLASELNSSYKNSVLNKMKLENNLVSATSTWLTNYEGINADLQQRVSYANGVLDYIKAKGL